MKEKQKFTKPLKIAIAVVVLSFIVAGVLYPIMPDTMATHWDSQGNVNGEMSKFWGLFLMPIISLALILLFIFLPKIDPYKENYKLFSKYYNGFILVLTLYLFYIYILTLLINQGINFNLIQAMSPAFAVLFYYLGILLENAKRNWFVGIRTPWTLSSEKVWTKTHNVGGKLFKVSAIISFFGVFLPQYAIWFIILPLMLSAIFVFLYSYFLFKKK